MTRLIIASIAISLIGAFLIIDIMQVVPNRTVRCVFVRLWLPEVLHRVFSSSGCTHGVYGLWLDDAGTNSLYPNDIIRALPDVDSQASLSV